jgi:biopolymer transport protein ExbD
MRRARLAQTPRRGGSDDESVLPLINVVFLLLIFFMLAGQLTSADPFDIDPPQSRSDGTGETAELTVQLGADGQLALEGETMDPAALQAAVAEQVKDGESIRVRLKADADAEATEVVAVMERLRAAGLRRLKLLTVQAAE